MCCLMSRAGRTLPCNQSHTPPRQLFSYVSKGDRRRPRGPAHRQSQTALACGRPWRQCRQQLCRSLRMTEEHGLNGCFYQWLHCSAQHGQVTGKVNVAASDSAAGSPVSTAVLRLVAVCANAHDARSATARTAHAAAAFIAPAPELRTRGGESGSGPGLGAATAGAGLGGAGRGGEGGTEGGGGRRGVGAEGGGVGWERGCAEEWRAEGGAAEFMFGRGGGRGAEGGGRGGGQPGAAAGRCRGLVVPDYWGIHPPSHPSTAPGCVLPSGYYGLDTTHPGSAPRPAPCRRPRPLGLCGCDRDCRLSFGGLAPSPGRLFGRGGRNPGRAHAGGARIRPTWAGAGGGLGSPLASARQPRLARHQCPWHTICQPAASAGWQMVPWPALCVCVRTCVLLYCSSCLWYIWNSNTILGAHACFLVSLCLLFASVGQALVRIIASLP